MSDLAEVSGNGRLPMAPGTQGLAALGPMQQDAVPADDWREIQVCPTPLYATMQAGMIMSRLRPLQLV